MLDRHHAPRGEALAVADAVDLVDDRHLRVAAPAGNRRAANAAAGRSTVRQAATSAWPITWPPNTRCQLDLRAAAAEQVHLELFEVEDGQQVLNGGGHAEHLSIAVV